MASSDSDQLQKSNEATPVFRFYVQVGEITQAVFTEVSGLTVEMAVEEIEEGGNNEFVHRVPGRCKVGNLTLKRGLTKSNEFFKWVMDVAKGKIEPKHVSIVQYTSDGKELLRWDFRDAYPIKWSGPQYKADANGSAIETLELAHKGMIMDSG